jgi:hypothetical protein
MVDWRHDARGAYLVQPTALSLSAMISQYFIGSMMPDPAINKQQCKQFSCARRESYVGRSKPASSKSANDFFVQNDSHFSTSVAATTVQLLCNS